ncbi:MAG TPA: chemotaxis protein CheW [Candidatus Limnocylindria bacterium]|nr:chemotaxis protein CheW [Candidatus Limnocylindria bacterium]
MESSPVLTAPGSVAAAEAAVDDRAPEAIVVRFGGARYGIPMADVAEVIQVPRLTRVPGSPSWLTGVANWRGRVLAVVDLRPVVGNELAPLPSSARLVVMTSDVAEAGLLVEAVSGLLSPDRPAPEPVPATVAPAVAELVTGVVDDGGPVSFLDVPAVLRLRSRLPSAHRTT